MESPSSSFPLPNMWSMSTPVYREVAAFLRPGILQAPLPGPHPGPQPLHLQPRILEPPLHCPSLMPCPHRLYSPHLLPQLGDSSSNQLGQSHGPHHHRLWLLAATHDVQLEVRHKQGAEMVAANKFSRAAVLSRSSQVCPVRPGSPGAGKSSYHPQSSFPHFPSKSQFNFQIQCLSKLLLFQFNFVLCS